MNAELLNAEHMYRRLCTFSLIMRVNMKILSCKESQCSFSRRLLGTQSSHRIKVKVRDGCSEGWRSCSQSDILTSPPKLLCHYVSSRLHQNSRKHTHESNESEIQIMLDFQLMLSCLVRFVNFRDLHVVFQQQQAAQLKQGLADRTAKTAVSAGI